MNYRFMNFSPIPGRGDSGKESEFQVKTIYIIQYGNMNSARKTGLK